MVTPKMKKLATPAGTSGGEQIGKAWEFSMRQLGRAIYKHAIKGENQLR